MEKTKEELLAYAISMKERGDNYRTIIDYLSKNTDESTTRGIVKIIDQLEKDNKIQQAQPKESWLPSLNILFGWLFLISGIVLLFFLWGKGVIATLPFVLMGLGVLALSGVIK